MSLQTALYRAEYNFLSGLAATTWRHFERSGRNGYFYYWFRLQDRLDALLPLCSFR